MESCLQSWVQRWPYIFVWSHSTGRIQFPLFPRFPPHTEYMPYGCTGTRTSQLHSFSTTVLNWKFVFYFWSSSWAELFSLNIQELEAEVFEKRLGREGKASINRNKYAVRGDLSLLTALQRHRRQPLMNQETGSQGSKSTLHLNLALLSSRTVKNK